MEYRTLGASGVQVSALCLGCMNFGERTDESQSIRIIHEAMEAGINFIDTANVYGRGTSEQIVGKALAEAGRRDDVFLATKFCGRMGRSPNQQGGSRYHIVHEVENSLRRLRTDRIDLYQMHKMDLSLPVEESLRALDDLVRGGKVLYIGTSKWAPALLTEAVMLARQNHWSPIVSEQPPYNLLDRRIENEVIWTCVHHGIGIIPWGPIASGILSGKYRSDAPPPPGARFQQSNYRLTQRAIERADALKPLAEEKGVTLAEFSLAWVLRQPGITAPIIGPASVDHLHSSLKALQVRFCEEDQLRINKIAPPGQAVSNYFDTNTAWPLRYEAGIVEERPWKRRRRSAR